MEQHGPPENAENRPRPRGLQSVELRAAIIAGIFSLLGVVLGVFLNQYTTSQFAEELRRQEVVNLIVRRAQGRWIRAQTVTLASHSSKFTSRWDDYILNGVTAWSEDYLVMSDGIDRFFPELKVSFEALQERFSVLHGALLSYHQAGGRPNEQLQQETRDIKDAVGVEVRAFSEELLARL